MENNSPMANELQREEEHADATDAERYAHALIEEESGESVVDPTYISALLLEALQEHERGNEGNDEETEEEGDMGNDGNDEENREEGGMAGSLCKLWDLSIDARICSLLLNLDVLALLEHFLVSPNVKPRIVEVSFGLLSNMTSNLSDVGKVACSQPVLHVLCRTIMTCTEPSALAESLRFLTAAVMTVRPVDVQGDEPRGMLDMMLEDETLLNQLLCIWLNTLNADLLFRTSALLHALVFTRPGIASLLLSLHLAPISCMVICQAAEKGQDDVVNEAIGIFHVLSVLETGSMQLRQESSLARALSLCGSRMHSGSLVVLQNLWGDDPADLPWLELGEELIEACVLHLSDSDQDISDSAWWVLTRASEQAGARLTDTSAHPPSGVDAVVEDGGDGDGEENGDGRKVEDAAVSKEAVRDAVSCLCRYAEVLVKLGQARIGYRERKCLEAVACVIRASLASLDEASQTGTGSGAALWGESYQGGPTRAEAEAVLIMMEGCLTSQH